jgi:hypothetical protein
VQLQFSTCPAGISFSSLPILGFLTFGLLLKILTAKFRLAIRFRCRLSATRSHESLEQIRQLDLVPSLYEEILIPAQVAAETAASGQPRSWVRKQSLSLPLLPAVQRPTLGAGEREAICLAIQVKAGAILLDDDPARKLATRISVSPPNRNVG